jgi:hypothetical protein
MPPWTFADVDAYPSFRDEVLDERRGRMASRARTNIHQQFTGIATSFSNAAMAWPPNTKT